MKRAKEIIDEILENSNSSIGYGIIQVKNSILSFINSDLIELIKQRPNIEHIRWFSINPKYIFMDYKSIQDVSSKEVTISELNNSSDLLLSIITNKVKFNNNHISDSIMDLLTDSYNLICHQLMIDSGLIIKSKIIHITKRKLKDKIINVDGYGVQFDLYINSYDNNLYKDYNHNLNNCILELKNNITPKFYDKYNSIFKETDTIKNINAYNIIKQILNKNDINYIADEFVKIVLGLINNFCIDYFKSHLELKGFIFFNITPTDEIYNCAKFKKDEYTLENGIDTKYVKEIRDTKNNISVCELFSKLSVDLNTLKKAFDIIREKSGLQIQIQRYTRMYDNNIFITFMTFYIDFDINNEYYDLSYSFPN